MKVTSDSYENNEIILGGNSLGTATIKNSPEFFQVLSDSLYSDKILAVCREIMCNAWDSHIASNKTNIPIFVNLDYNTISIRDFGEGIPKERIQEIYFQYGNSLKTNDVNQTGGFGLGSKAPFAYVDTFTVISRNNGLETKYKLIKAGSNEDGNPEIIEIYSKPTLETGLEVIVNIKNMDDYIIFKNNISKITYFGDILCVLNNAFDFPLETINLTKENSYYIHTKKYDDYFTNLFYKSINSNTDSKVIAIIGNVAYPVNLEKIFKNVFTELKILFKNYEFYRFVFKIFNKNITITPSRESISYTSKTVEIINKELMKNINKFKQNFYKFKKEFINKELLTNFTNITNGSYFLGDLLVIKLNNFIKDTDLSYKHKENMYNFMFYYYATLEKDSKEKLIKNNIKLFKYVYKYTKISKFFRKSINKNSYNHKNFGEKDSIYLKTIVLIKGKDNISSVNLNTNDFKYIDNIDSLPYNILVIKNTKLYDNDNKFNIVKEQLAKRGIKFIKKEIEKPKKITHTSKKSTYIVELFSKDCNNLNFRNSNFSLKDISKDDYLISYTHYSRYLEYSSEIEKIIKNTKKSYKAYVYDTPTKFTPKSILKNHKNFFDFFEEIILPELDADLYHKIDLFLYLFFKKNINNTRYYYINNDNICNHKFLWELFFKKEISYKKDYLVNDDIKKLYFNHYTNNVDLKKLYQPIKKYFKKNIFNKKYLNELANTMYIYDSINYILPHMYELSFKEISQIIKIYSTKFTKINLFDQNKESENNDKS